MYQRTKGVGSYKGTAIGFTQVMNGPFPYVGKFLTVHENHAKRFYPHEDMEAIERIFHDDNGMEGLIKPSSPAALDEFFADVFELRPSRRLDDAYTRLSAFRDTYLTEYGCQPEFTNLNSTPIDDLDYVLKDRFLIPLKSGKDIGGELTDFTEGTFAANVTQRLIRTKKPSTRKSC